MEISILVTVKNDLENVKLLISSLSKLSDDFEVIMVDGFSTDGTFEYLQTEKERSNFLLARKGGNRAVGRNECIRLANGKKFVFLDSDTEIASDWEASFKRSMNRDILAGRIVQRSDFRWSDLDRVPILYKGKDVTYPSNNLMYSKTVIDRIGNFDERFNTGEDIDLNIRAIDSGYEIFYDREVIVSHHPRQSYSSVLRQSYSDGIGRRLIQKKYGLKSSFNRVNLKKHPLIEGSRLAFGMLGYLFGRAS